MEIDSYSPGDVRYELEEAIRSVLKKDFKFKENTTFEDRWLILAFGASCFAVYGGVYNYLNPFQDSKDVLKVCVFFYFLLTGILSLHDYFIKDKIIFQGSRKDPLGLEPNSTISVSFSIVKFSSDFTLEISKKSKMNSIKKSIAEWINIDGDVVQDEIKKDLKNLLGMKKD
jgi:signal peptidase complex subunit 2